MVRLGSRQFQPNVLQASKGNQNCDNPIAPATLIAAPTFLSKPR
jgi:hypothetical protein